MFAQSVTEERPSDKSLMSGKKTIVVSLLKEYSWPRIVTKHIGGDILCFAQGAKIKNRKFLV